MGKATLAHQRAIGAIGQARAQKLIDAGLIVLFVEEHNRLTARIADLERRVKLLRDVTIEGSEEIAAKVLKEAMTR